MRVRRSRVGLVPSLVVAALVAAGCSGGHDPVTLPTDTPTSATPQSTPTPRATKTPKPTKSARPTKSPQSTKTPKGSLEKQLLATTKAFYAAVITADTTFDIAELEKLSAKGCGACSRYIASVKTIKRRHQHYSDAGRFIVKNYHAVKGYKRSDPTRGATYTLIATPAVLVDSSGAVVQRYPRFKGKVFMSFTRVEGRWLVLAEQDM